MSEFFACVRKPRAVVFAHSPANLVLNGQFHTHKTRRHSHTHTYIDRGTPHTHTYLRPHILYGQVLASRNYLLYGLAHKCGQVYAFNTTGADRARHTRVICTMLMRRAYVGICVRSFSSPLRSICVLAMRRAYFGNPAPLETLTIVTCGAPRARNPPLTFPLTANGTCTPLPLQPCCTFALTHTHNARLPGHHWLIAQHCTQGLMILVGSMSWVGAHATQKHRANVIINQ